MGLLARIATPATRHSAHERQSAMLAREAFVQLFPGSVNDEPTRQATAEPAIRDTARRSSLRVQVTALEVSHQTFASGPGAVVSRVRRREYCACGTCKWCLDNARWERIFNEKFADPAYYARVTVRHGSSLAGAR